MKKSIEWHEECLSNSKNHLRNKKIELEFLTAYIADQERRNNFYELQIDTARKNGITEFDSNSFFSTMELK
jgi:hypothetical protein